MYKLKKENFAIIIQARLTSTRLPNKIILPFNKSTVLEYLIKRLKLMGFNKNLFITIPNNKANNFLKYYLYKKKIKFFTGPENNLIQRYINVCKNIKHKYIIRLTADNPLIEKKILHFAINNHIQKKNKVSSTRFVKKNKIIRYFPKGQSIDIFNRDIFLSIKDKKINNFDKEHVISYFQKKFKFNKISNNKLKMTFKFKNYSIDTIEDYFRLIKL